MAVATSLPYRLIFDLLNKFEKLKEKRSDYNIVQMFFWGTWNVMLFMSGFIDIFLQLKHWISDIMKQDVSVRFYFLCWWSFLFYAITTSGDNSDLSCHIKDSQKLQNLPFTCQKKHNKNIIALIHWQPHYQRYFVRFWWACWYSLLVRKSTNTSTCIHNMSVLCGGVSVTVLH